MTARVVPGFYLARFLANREVKSISQASFRLLYQICQTNIRNLPHTLPYHLCFNVNRRRLETTAASEYLKTPEVGPPSNGSSMEDSLVNSDETDVENNVSSNEQADELSPEEGFNCDERQVNGERKASPNQTGMTYDNFTHAYIEIEKAVFLQLFRERIVG